MPTTHELPAELIVDPEAKEVIITPEITASMPNAATLFAAADKAFERDPRGYLLELEHSVSSFRSTTGANIEYSLIPGNGSEAFIMWAPFSDGPPLSSAEQMYAYTQLPVAERGLADKVFAKPNSWNQITKSAVMAEALKASGVDMPVLTIFSPLPSFPFNAYTRAEYGEIRRGDFRPSARITEEVLADAQDQLHGPVSETQIDGVNVHGASLGASNAAGAAAGMVEQGDKDVITLTTQELIAAPKNITDLAARFTARGVVGEESALDIADHYPKLGEPLLRMMIDGAGNEPAMFAHMLRGMSKLSRLKGLTGGSDNMTPENIHFLLDNGTSVAIPLAENSGLTHDTYEYLPDAGEQVVDVRAVAGQRVAHLLDEYLSPTILLAAMHVAGARR